MVPRRVVVCGSNYGAAYVRALRERPDTYQFAGVLARGSPRSHRLADRSRVPLWTTVEEIPLDIDLACAAMGHAAFNIVLDLLRRGIHVVLEHPVWPDQVERATAEASTGGVSLHINTLFASLAAPRAFIDACRARSAPPAYLDVLVTDRSLYATLDILRQSFGSLASMSVVPARSGNGFHSFEGTLGGVSTLIRVQRSGLDDGRRLSDGGAGYLVDCRISAWFDGGTLTLLSVAGPVIWNGSFRRNAPLADRPWRTLHAARISYGDLLAQHTLANVEAIDTLSAHAAGGTCPEVQRPEHLLDVARGWKLIAQHLAGGAR